MSNQNILIILEGIEPDQTIFIKINELLGLGFHINIIFGASIYELYRTIKTDPTAKIGGLDTFELIKANHNTSTKSKLINSKVFDNYTSSDFAYIYLFFDFDPWAADATKAKPLSEIKDILKLFNNPTSYGLLYINYPAVESFIHVTKNFQHSHYHYIPSEYIPGKNDYKNIVAKSPLIDTNPYFRINKITYDKLIKLMELHLKKANFVCNNKHEIPDDESDTSQIKLCDIQYDFYTTESKIYIISSIPIFLFELKGPNLFNIFNEVHT